jgi:hypothetical protein
VTSKGRGYFAESPCREVPSKTASPVLVAKFTCRIMRSIVLLGVDREKGSPGAMSGAARGSEILAASNSSQTAAATKTGAWNFLLAVSMTEGKGWETMYFAPEPMQNRREINFGSIVRDDA